MYPILWLNMHHYHQRTTGNVSHLLVQHGSFPPCHHRQCIPSSGSTWIIPPLPPQAMYPIFWLNMDHSPLTTTCNVSHLMAQHASLSPKNHRQCIPSSGSTWIIPPLPPQAMYPIFWLNMDHSPLATTGNVSHLLAQHGS